MTNKEFYKEQILDVVCKGKSFGLNEDSMTICECNDVPCFKCYYNKKGTSCIANIEKWCNEEYVKPCPFNKDELVEVSDDKVNWKIRHFSHITEIGCFATFYNGRNSKETDITSTWIYCQKYGTLGGIVTRKEEQ